MQQPCRRLLDRGPTSGSTAYPDLAPRARTDFTAGYRPAVFVRREIRIDFATKSRLCEARYALKSVVRLRAGNVGPCEQIKPFNLFCICSV